MNLEGPSAISLTFTLLALPACGTEDFPGHPLIPGDQPGPDQGGVVVAFSPTEETDEAVNRDPTSPAPTRYYLFLDGQVVARSRTGQLFTTSVGGAPEGIYYLGAGPHHFTIVAPGQSPVFEGDGQVPGAGTVHLFLYGPLDDVKGVFAAVPKNPSAGNEHITVVNLLRSGQTIEVVSCTDATTCTPVSSALALGEVFDAEVPAVFDDCDPASGSSVPGSWRGGCFTSLTTSGAGIGYRLVPTASVPDPPVNALAWGVSDSGSTEARPFIAAPVFMTEQGQPQYVLY